MSLLENDKKMLGLVIPTLATSNAEKYNKLGPIRDWIVRIIDIYFLLQRYHDPTIELWS